MSKPIFNLIVNDFNAFVDAHIVHISPEFQEKFKAEAEALILKAIEAGAKGAAEGLGGSVNQNTAAPEAETVTNEEKAPEEKQPENDNSQESNGTKAPDAASE